MGSAPVPLSVHRHKTSQAQQFELFRYQHPTEWLHCRFGLSVYFDFFPSSLRPFVSNAVKPKILNVCIFLHN
jgi:hypothetical protein